MSRFYTWVWYFHCWLWTSICRLRCEQLEKEYLFVKILYIGFEPFCLQLRGNEMLHTFFVIFNEGISYYLCKCIKLNTISKRGGAKFLQVMWVWYKLFTLSLGKVLQRYSVKDCFENIHKKNTYVPKGTILKLPKRCYIALGLYLDSPQCMCKKSINGNFVHCTRYLDLIDFTCFFYKQLGSGPNPQSCLYF